MIKRCGQITLEGIIDLSNSIEVLKNLKGLFLNFNGWVKVIITIQNFTRNIKILYYISNSNTSNRGQFIEQISL